MVDAQYTPDWDSLDQRPLPAWYDQVKFGIFLHWGVYSVPAWGTVGSYAEWYWKYQTTAGHATQEFHNATYGPDFRYQEFAEQFRAELWDPTEWASLFQKSGAKYVVLTSKHHEGFTLWKSAQSWNWNSVDIGPKRDIVAELSAAVRAQNLHMGLYYSLYEWFNPLYIGPNPEDYVQQIMLPQAYEIVNKYKPDLFWTDGAWDFNSSFWQSTKFLAWLYNESPVKDVVVVNDRWGNETPEKHGGFYTVEYGYGSIPDDHKWESCHAIGQSFGYNRLENSINAYWNATTLVQYLIQVVAMGGNLLLDLGPTADGRIPVEMQERVLAMGDWLSVNGEAIYNTQKWTVPKSSDDIWYTSNKQYVYAHFFRWIQGAILLPEIKPDQAMAVTMLGAPEIKISWRAGDGGKGTLVTWPTFTSPDALPCQHAWVLRFSLP